MATAKANITIGGTKIDPYHVSLQQRCDRHHRFQITVSAEKVESEDSISIKNSLEYIRKTAEIRIECAGNELRFKGIITAVNLDRTYAGDSLIIFKGFSPTYLLEHGAESVSYAEKDLSGIADEIFKQYPSNLIKGLVSPQYSGSIDYVVQYKETNYQFLSRLAAIHNEWFFYDGASVVFGELPEAPEVELEFGNDLSAFEYGVDLRPANFDYRAYNYAEDKDLSNPTSSFKPDWLDTSGKKALDESDELFPFEAPTPVWYDAGTDDYIKHLAEARKSAILSDISVFEGRSVNAGVAIGGTVNVGEIGTYRILTVTHQFDSNKDYTNTFEAIPSSVTKAPVNRSIFKPEAESQIAIVQDNNDPDEMGRVRVQFKWQQDKNLMTPWIRQMTNYASGDRGMYFTPEIGDQVYVDFEQGNPDRPYVQGALYHGKATPEYFDKDNNLKAIKSRSGHTILLDDKDGEEKIQIFDKEGTIISFDTKNKSLTINAPEDIDITAKNINITADENVNIYAKGELNAGSDGDTNIAAEGNLTAAAKGDNNVTADGNVEVQSSGDTNISSSGALNASASGNATVSGQKATLSGNAQAEVKGQQTTVQGSMTSVMGASGKIDVM